MNLPVITAVTDGIVEARIEIRCDSFVHFKVLIEDGVVLDGYVDFPSSWNDDAGRVELEAIWSPEQWAQAQQLGLIGSPYDTESYGCETTRGQRATFARALRFARRILTTGLNTRSLEAQARELAALGKAFI